MCVEIFRRLTAVVCVLAAFSTSVPSRADDLTSEVVLKSIDRAKRFLVSEQNGEGSWSAGQGGRYKVGVSSLALLALINAGMTVDDEPVQKGLHYLRSGLEAREPNPKMTYEISLMIMAMAAAKDGQKDNARIFKLAEKLETSQFTKGDNAGSWSYSVAKELLDLGGDRSNGQFAILGLRDAAHAGIPVSRRTWQRAYEHWVAHQNADGGWSYSGTHKDPQPSTGSMTVAGVATLIITSSMLRDDKDMGADGTPNCCPEYQPNEPLERGIRWLEKHFTIRTNPRSNAWLLYYLYGMERAGRLSGHRFFGKHDWYREGAKFLIDRQSRRWSSWMGVGGMEANPVIGTSFALLFLSKGLAPVLISKLKYGRPDPVDREQLLSDDWNNHHDDIRHLTQLISGLPKWPKLLNWQVIDIRQVARYGGVEDLLQSPILYLSGQEKPEFTAKQIELLKEYVNQGGFIFAVANCQRADFPAGFRALIRDMYPNGEMPLKPLPADHPVYRSEYLLEPDSVELYGVDVGCRTAIIYSPDDLSCLWDKWALQKPPGRTKEMTSMIGRATRVGVNVVAYATGREPPNPLESSVPAPQKGQQDRIQRGFLQIAKLRHTGGWNAAPQALRNLLLGLNRVVGMTASTKQKNLPATDPNIFKYPIVYMHGRNRFQLGRPEREQLKKYLNNGGFLFADACCGAWQFNESFRSLIKQMFPAKELKRIPPDHELFTTGIAYDIRRVKRRTPMSKNPKAALDVLVREVEPFLEGIEIDGRYAVIYSKYDISCALERQASLACEGYVEADALKIAINVILYALLEP